MRRKGRWLTFLDHSCSYTMDLEEKTKISDSDSVIDDESNGFTIVCDPKSLLYLFGTQPASIRFSRRRWSLLPEENYVVPSDALVVWGLVAGLQLDYSDALIGGGFQFQNPNSCVPQREEAVDGRERLCG